MSEVKFSKDGVNIGGSIGGEVGINLASGEVTSSLGTSRVDVNGPTAELQIGGKLNLDKNMVDVSVNVVATAKATDIRAKIISKKVCTKNNCLVTTLTAYAGIGIGAEAGVGHISNQNQKTGSFTATAGLGCGSMLGGNMVVERELKEQNIGYTEKDSSINSTTTPPRPLL